MKKNTVVLMFMFFGLVLYMTFTNSNAENVGGSINDPLVTKSYVDEKLASIEKLKTELEEKFSTITSGTSAVTDKNKAESSSATKADLEKRVEELEKAMKQKTENSYSASEVNDSFLHSDIFTVLEGKQGNKIILGAGSECVLRGGEALVIASESGGLADLTAGTDLSTDTVVPLQHLLLSSRNDGRGLFITSERTAYIMVRGDYKIK